MKILNRDEYLKALGLWHLAKEHRQKCEEFETAMNALLEDDNGSHASDSIWQDGDTLDAALERMKITVEAL